MTPGEYQIQDGDIELCAGRERIELDVSNTGDRPVQVGSHFHFFHRLSISFGMGTAKIALIAFFECFALLVTDDHHFVFI